MCCELRFHVYKKYIISAPGLIPCRFFLLMSISIIVSIMRSFSHLSVSIALKKNSVYFSIHNKTIFLFFFFFPFFKSSHPNRSLLDVFFYSSTNTHKNGNKVIMRFSCYHSTLAITVDSSRENRKNMRIIPNDTASSSINRLRRGNQIDEEKRTERKLHKLSAHHSMNETHKYYRIFLLFFTFVGHICRVYISRVIKCLQ